MSPSGRNVLTLQHLDVQSYLGEATRHWGESMVLVPEALLKLTTIPETTHAEKTYLTVMEPSASDIRILGCGLAANDMMRVTRFRDRPLCSSRTASLRFVYAPRAETAEA